MALTHTLRALCGLALGVAACGAHAAYTFTTFGAAQWGASDTTLGVDGYTLEDFEDTVLASGLAVSRLNGAAGNFGPSTLLPASAVFDPLSDNDTDVANPANSIQAFRRGVWDGNHVLINHPGPAFYHWYSDAANWKDLRFDFADGATSVGFSLQQLDQHGNRLLINDVEQIADLLGLMGSDTEFQNATEGPFSFNSRHGYLRIDATGGDLIHSITFDNSNGDGMAIDHLAFRSAAPVPVPGALLLCASGLAGLAARRRRR